MSTDIEIQIKGLSKAFGAHQVLNGIDLEILKGELVVIVGGSGCGKTVLLNHVLSQLEPDQGEVLVADHGREGAPLVNLAKLGQVQLSDLHTHWGMVFQRNALFSGSVFDNIQLWLHEIKHMDDEDIVPIARRVLQAVALDDSDDFLDTDTNSLSGGMAKRLAVARALSMNPNVIFYDEPTTGLDPTSALQIQDLILTTHEQGANSQRTTVIITHDKDLLNRLAPRIIMLHDGKVYFDGSFVAFSASTSPIIRPYFDHMPTLHQGRV
ncbi:ABC transporter ATP-binding protein [Magnetovibrio blakemorei]|uniref:ABC transporter n=1 Tax=Magnetovibrio blakemorei TaxID=28181 RepID=A0A1E5Q8W4_9PROT|nr:ATP-binding cassette domain-containing protein [Magnetovibrio blakemorei]OEJ67904.1 ABC transporter [Magnetovibrio blakemorei]